MRVDVPYEITPKQLSDFVTTAVEGGMSDSWLHEFANVSHPDFRSADGVVFWGAPAYFEQPGYAIEARFDKESDEEGEGTGRTKITEAEFAKGLQIMATKHPDHFAALLTEEADGITGDVFLQCVLLGKIVYG